MKLLNGCCVSKLALEKVDSGRSGSSTLPRVMLYNIRLAAVAAVALVAIGVTATVAVVSGAVAVLHCCYHVSRAGTNGVRRRRRRPDVVASLLWIAHWVDVSWL